VCLTRRAGGFELIQDLDLIRHDRRAQEKNA